MFFKKAVLVIHGLAGGTYDVEYLTNKMQSISSFDVYAFTLPGHDKVLQSKAKKEDWIISVEQQIEMLIGMGYKRIYVVGHSMGGILATHVAGKYKEVKKVVLAAPAFIHILSKENGNFNDKLKKAPEVIRGYGIGEVVSRIFKMAPISMIEFLSLTKKYKDIPKNIRKPILIIQGLKDELVPIESSYYVYNNVLSRTKKLILYSNANHDLFRGVDNESVCKEIIRFLKYTPYLSKQVINK